MRTIFRDALLVGATVAALLSGARPARAQEPAGATPPTLKTRVEAVYPPDALRDRAEATVGLELDVDENGRVTGARVVRPAGRGFDEAAVAAVKAFTFEPAKQGGVPIKSTIVLSYEFHLPPAAPSPTPPPNAPTPGPPPAPGEVTQEGPEQSTLVLARRPMSAASSFAAQDREFQLRPIGSVQDILRVTPGLVVVQHSGG